MFHKNLSKIITIAPEGVVSFSSWVNFIISDFFILCQYFSLYVFRKGITSTSGDRLRTRLYLDEFIFSFVSLIRTYDTNKWERL